MVMEMSALVRVSKSVCLWRDIWYLNKKHVEIWNHNTRTTPSELDISLYFHRPFFFWNI